MTAGSPVDLPGGIGGVTSTSPPLALTFENYRGADMPFSLDTAGTDSSDFTVTSNCPLPVPRPTIAAPAVGSTAPDGTLSLTPGTCTFSIVFAPAEHLVDDTRSATVTLNVSASSGLPAHSLPFTISGAASAPLKVASAPDVYVASPGSSQKHTLEISDRTGTAFRVCVDTSAPFGNAGDYTLPDLSTDSDGCGLAPAAAPGTSLPRPVDIDVLFKPGKGGTSNATLNVQRLDPAGAPVGRVYPVSLQGNQGAYLATPSAPLFDGISVEETGHATADATLVVSSRGNADVIFSGTSLGGDHPEDYTVVPGGCTLLSTLPAYSSGAAPQCTYTLRFDPSDVDGRNATFTVTTGGGSATTIQLKGAGKRAPRLVVTEAGAPVAANATLDFGHQTVHGLYPARILKLANVGTTGPLQIALIGDPPSGFTAGAGTDCASLPARSNCNLTVTFAPAAPQPYAGTLTLQSTPPGSGPTTFALTVTGSGDATATPVLEWQNDANAPISSVEFGDVVAGASSPTTVKVHNHGQGGVQVHLVNVTGLDASQFALTASPNCQPEQDLYEGDDCDLTVTFTPSGAGAKSAVLQLASGGSTLAPIPVHGSGVAGSGSVLTVSAASLSFAPTEVGTQSQPLRVVLSNGGAAGITVQGMDVTGDFAIASGSCGAPPIALPASGQCDVTLVFRPGTEGPASGRMRIQSDASTTPSDVALAGNGTSAPDLSSGGCSLARHGGRIDPTLWALMLGALGVLAWRLRARRRRQGTSR